MSNLIKYDYKRLTPFKWFVLENFPFIEADFDAITNYQLYCKVVEYLNKTIDSMNQTGEVVEEFTQKFINLQNYIDNYFDNLDVQEEINNKLDQMTEDGTFKNILSKIINKDLIKIFNNLEELLNSSSLIEGNICKTNYYENNDNGGSYYLITTKNTEENGITIFNTTNGLQANLILNDTMFTSQFAISKNLSDSDISNKLNFINNLTDVKNLIFDKSNYKISNTVTFNRDINIDFNNSTINSDCVNETFNFTGNLIDTTNIAEEYSPQDYFNIKVVSPLKFKENYLIAIKSNTNYNSEREYYKKGIVTLIDNINENNIKILNNLPFTIEAGSKVLLYDGIVVNIKNLILNGINNINFINSSNITDFQNFGIKLSYCKNSSLQNIIVDNFLHCIYEVECFNITNNKIITKHTLPANFTNQYSYGLALIACNLINTKNSFFNSGTHGVTYGNDTFSCETSFELNFENCLFASENDSYGFGCHHNAMNINIKNSIIKGALFSNNTTVENCKFFTTNYIALYYGDNDKFYNYIFKNCDFKYAGDNEQSLFITRAPFENAQISNNLINNIILDNCNDVYLYTNKLPNDIDSNNTPTINNIIIKNSKNIEIIHLNYNIKNLFYQNNISLNDKNILNLSSNVENAIISNCKISARYNVIVLSNTNNITIENSEFVDIGAINNSINIQNENTNISFNNVKAPLTNSRGIEFENGCNLSIINSTLHIRSNLNLLNGKNLSVINSFIMQRDSTKLKNIIQNENGLHFEQIISDDGNVSYSKIN